MVLVMLAIAGMAVAGAAVILFATVWGAGISPDSISYVQAARNLLMGRGLSVFSPSGELGPLLHFPPLFPVALAAIGIPGVDPAEGARWLNALVFGANITLVGLIVYRATRGSLWIALLSSWLMLASYTMLVIHSTAITEPLFILCVLLTLLLLDAYIERPRLWLLVSTALVAAMGLMTRYIGGALVFTGAWMLFFLNKRTGRSRLRDLVVFVCVSCLPALLWSIRNLYLAGAASDRKLAYHPVTLQQFDVALDALSRWLVPVRLPGMARGAVVFGELLVLVALWALTVVLSRNRARAGSAEPTSSRLQQAFITIFLAYLGFLILSISFFDAATPLDLRMLSPLFVAGLIVLLCLLDRLLHLTENRRVMRPAIIALCALLALSYSISAVAWSVNNHNTGGGYASKAWRQSELLDQIKGMPPNTVIFSNGADAIYWLTGRTAYGLPAKKDINTQSVYENYPAGLASVGDRLKKDDGILVYFDLITWRDYLPSEDELTQALPLKLIKKTGAGAIYRIEQ